MTFLYELGCPVWVKQLEKWGIVVEQRAAWNAVQPLYSVRTTTIDDQLVIHVLLESDLTTQNVPVDCPFKV